MTSLVLIAAASVAALGVGFVLAGGVGHVAWLREERRRRRRRARRMSGGAV